jgi:hypothetical protein
MDDLNSTRAAVQQQMKETSQPTEIKGQANKGLDPTRNTHKVPSISIHLADAFYLTTLMVACDITKISHMPTPSTVVPPVHTDGCHLLIYTYYTQLSNYKSALTSTN